jgi:hypothetical protein
MILVLPPNYLGMDSLALEQEARVRSLIIENEGGRIHPDQCLNKALKKG